jgi:hypothetical protein
MEKEELKKSRFSFLKFTYILVAVGILSILIAGFLSFRIFQRLSHKPPLIPRQTDVSLIKPWMTIPYVAKTYAVPKEVLFEKLNLDPNKYRKESIESIAKNKAINQDSLITALKETITEFKSSPPPSTPTQ